MELSHINIENNPKIVDVSEKADTERVAIASGEIYMSKAAFLAIKENRNKKGPVLQTAIIGAIMGAKKTSEIIPMCHPIPITGIDTKIDELENGFRLWVTVKTIGKTGVEMEALSAVSIGLLTIYDMVKAIDKGMRIQNIQLEHKSGGKSNFSRGGGPNKT